MTQETKTIQKKEESTPAEIERTRSKHYFIPPVDIHETNGDIVVTTAMPGVDEKSVDVVLEENILTITGRIEPETHEGYTLVYSEYDMGDYERSFRISEEINRDKITAIVKDGLLRLTLPKAAPAKAKKITVKSG